MQIFRRSHLPWSDPQAHPPEAPHDAQVRAWMKRETLPKTMTAPVARLLEKALARKPDRLDLSSASPRALENLPVSLLLRLRGPTRCLVLPDDCPVRVASRLMLEVGATRIEPAALLDAVEENWRPVARPKRDSDPTPTDDPTGAPGSMPIHQTVAPEVTARQRELVDKMQSRSPLRVSSQELDAALGAMRPINAWYRDYAGGEGAHARCAMSSGDADALARALRDAPMELLRTHEKSAMVGAKATLARRRPGDWLPLEPKQVRDLGVALDAVRTLAAETGGEAPALPARHVRAPQG